MPDQSASTVTATVKARVRYFRHMSEQDSSVRLDVVTDVVSDGAAASADRAGNSSAALISQLSVVEGLALDDRAEGYRQMYDELKTRLEG